MLEFFYSISNGENLVIALGTSHTMNNRGSSQVSQLSVLLYELTNHIFEGLIKPINQKS